MLRTTVLLCAVMLMQAVSVRTVLEHPVCWSVSPGDDADGTCSPTCVPGDCRPDEALVAGRVVIAHPSSPSLQGWREPELAVAPFPAPDEISHVPKPVLA